MHTRNKKTFFSTNDELIRATLMEQLEKLHAEDPVHRIVEELGVNHGSARVDVAVINGVLHGYEIKSDRDTLLRLPGQIRAYNAVFDKVTIIVGFSHKYEAMEMIPDWWGISIAKVTKDGHLVFNEIRKAEFNQNRDAVSIARLLWREEALNLLEEMNEAKGFYSKPRTAIYEKLAVTLETNALAHKVRETLCLRSSWRSAEQLV